MKNSVLYTLVFTVALCAACAAMLTFAEVNWRDRIAANKEYAHTRAIVEALGLCDEDTPRENAVTAFDERVELQEKKNENDADIYVGTALENGEPVVVGYAIDLVAKGKNGPIRGTLALEPDKRHIKAFRIYEHEETPGLGARITEATWLRKFVGVPVEVDGQEGIIISNKVKGANVVDGITGASMTTFALGNSLNAAIATVRAGGRKLEAVDFGLGADAVTRATPGYPKSLKKPENFQVQTKRPPFMAPPGITNIALDKPAICSLEEDDFIDGFADQITDGVKKCREGDYVDIGPNPQWAQVDLKGEHTVFCVVVWHYYRNPVIYRDVIIQVSNDPDFKQGVTTLFNNDHDNSSGLGTGGDPSHLAAWWGEVGDARGSAGLGTQCRYVRVNTNGGCGDESNRFVEIAVYGQ